MRKYPFSRKARRWSVGLSVAAICLLASSAQAAPDEARKEELRYLLEQDCGSCHGLTRKGGLGSPLLPENVSETSDEALLEVILEGIPGTPMPPWKFLLSREDAVWLIELIRKGVDHEG